MIMIKVQKLKNHWQNHINELYSIGLVCKITNNYMTGYTQLSSQIKLYYWAKTLKYLDFNQLINKNLIITIFKGLIATHQILVNLISYYKVHCRISYLYFTYIYMLCHVLTYMHFKNNTYNTFYKWWMNI